MASHPLSYEEFTCNPFGLRNLCADSPYLHENEEFQGGGGRGYPEASWRYGCLEVLLPLEGSITELLRPVLSGSSSNMRRLLLWAS